jgi:mono/diheme cytochrome c family protein
MNGRRIALPLGAGLLVAATTFGIVSLVDGGGSGSDDAGRGSGPTATRATTRTAAVARGRTVFAAMGCGSCHTLAAAGSSGTIGPNLDVELAGHTRASLRATIVSPPASYMPRDFGKRLDDAELGALVTFLLVARER